MQAYILANSEVSEADDPRTNDPSESVNVKKLNPYVE